MRHVGRHEHEIVAAVVRDVIADKTAAAAIHRQREFVFRVVVPLERYLRELPMVDAD